MNLVDQYYPAWKAKTNPRFAEINRNVTHPEMTQAFQMLVVQACGWRKVVPPYVMAVALRE